MKENKEMKYRVQTNSRYPHFKQQQYTVGDEEQFIDAIKDLKELQNQDLVMDELNIFKDITTRDFPSNYKNQEKLKSSNNHLTDRFLSFLNLEKIISSEEKI